MLKRLPLCVTMALIFAGMLAMPGCGVRGSLETPPQAKNETGNAAPGSPGTPTPHQPSILDPLIR
jgi:predicted small lipoprotein YifL